MESCYCTKLYLYSYLWSLTVSARLVFNKDIRAIGSADRDALAFIQALKTLLGSVIKIGFEPPVYKIFPTKLYRDVTDAIKTMYSFGIKHAEKLQEESSKADGKGLLEQWLTGGKLSKDLAIITAIDMFAAGIETVGLCQAFRPTCSYML